jgi:ribosome-associated translation inhibitor RaiA/cold shock CspA family protein
MQTGVEIVFHNMDRSPAVEARVSERIDRLERRFGRLTSFRATIDAPHRHHHKGKHYAVRLEAHVPSGILTIDREPGDDNAHADILVTVRDAFDAMERKLKAWADTHGGRPEAHAVPLQGRIAELHPDRDFGQIALTDGRLVYFHRHSVVEGRFDDLAEGDTVELAIAEGDSPHGPHASTVRPISSARFVDAPR